MSSKTLLVGILGFWALSIIGSPIAWLYQSDENIAITLNTAEEETGKTAKADPLGEKLISQNRIPLDNSWAAELAEPSRTAALNLTDFYAEVHLPPPERL